MIQVDINVVVGIIVHFDKLHRYVEIALLMETRRCWENQRKRWPQMIQAKHTYAPIKLT